MGRAARFGEKANMTTTDERLSDVKPRPRVGLGAIVLLSVLAMLLFLAAAFIVGLYVSARQLQSELDQIKAAGEPLTAADLDALYAYSPKDRDTTQLWLTPSR